MENYKLDPSIENYNKRFRGITRRGMLTGTMLCVIIPIYNQMMWLRTIPLAIPSIVIQILLVVVDRLYFRLTNRRLWSTMEVQYIIAMANVAAVVPEVVDVAIVQQVNYGKYLDLGMLMLLAFSTQALGVAMCMLLYAPLFGRTVSHDKPWFATSMSQILQRLFDDGNSVVGESSRTIKNASKSFIFYKTNLPKKFYLVFITGCCVTAVYQTSMFYIIPVLRQFSVACFFIALGSQTIPAIILSPSSGFSLITIAFDAVSAHSYLASAFMLKFMDAVHIYLGSVFIVAIGIGFHLSNFVGSKHVSSIMLFDADDSVYNVSRILETPILRVDVNAYAAYSPPHMSVMLYMSYVGTFMFVGAAMAQFICGPMMTILRSIPNVRTLGGLNVTASAMFYSSISIAFVLCQAWNGGCSWSCIVVAMLAALMLCVPVGSIRHATGIQVDITPFLEVLEGFMHSGDPMTSIIFKLYGQTPIAVCLAMCENIDLLSPKHDNNIMHSVGVHVWALCVATTTYCVTVYTAVTAGFDCTTPGWECHNSNMFYWKSVLWGLIGPQQALTSMQLWVLAIALASGAAAAVALHFVSKRNGVVVNIPLALSKVSAFPLLNMGMLNTFIIGSVCWHFTVNVWVHKKYHLAIATSLCAGAAISVLIVGLIPVTGLDWWGTNPQC